MADEEWDDDPDPLEVVPVAVEIEAYRLLDEDPSLLRLYFRLPGVVNARPGGDLAGVRVDEGSDEVVISIIRRVLFGDAPKENAGYAKTLNMGPRAGIDVQLAHPLGSRPLKDAATFSAVAPTEQDEAAMGLQKPDVPVWRRT